ncbi:MAG: NAD(P)H-hydrate dehydratase [Planctomycetes bacterium]|nr:NAD(P)H-hydrate dehydratase [Planctomycetota bacterium]MCP4771262.1 NAD(P)H-hydrate dehydratase [Planctomycetota bacterium]MCP4862011.1 NAD(P)H-hydrate dehydratase [Planctomycetota bacterium]
MNPNPLPALPPRAQDAHKGDCGRVLLIAGSNGMAGAVALAATAALRSGAGYVEVVCPASLLPALTKAVPAAMVHCCGDSDRQQLQSADLATMLELAQRCQAVVLGPGLGAPSESIWLPQLLSELQSQQPELPVLIDADGLNHLAASNVDLGICTPHMILTPHPGEAARLLGWSSAADVQQDRSAAIAAFSAKTAATVVLKGAGTLVQQQESPCWQNQSGNVGMATAGSGDVLSGHIGALLAAGLEPREAARLGVYLHGLAGDMFVAEWGHDGLTASDLAMWISKAMQKWRANPTEAAQ